MSVVQPLESFVIVNHDGVEVAMASNSAQTPDYETVIKMVRLTSAAQRLALVQDVLATLAPDLALTPPRQPTLSHALGLLATDQPAPSDSDIATLLDERRRERYGL